MDDGSPSEGSFWSHLLGLFKQRNGHSLEAHLASAKDAGDLGPADATMILNILRLGSRTVFEIMVPRTDIVCASIEDSIATVCGLIIEHGHSRIPIYEGDKDNIVGIVHAKDLLKCLLSPDGTTTSLTDIMRKPLFIPDNKIAREMLLEFQSAHMHLAICLDEYGGTSGLLTLEDVLEEIVGDIEDEYDLSRPDDIQPLEDGSWLVSGRTPLEELNEELGSALNSEQVETIGGFLCEISGRVPKQGEQFSAGALRFTVRDADKKKVRWIHVEPDRQP